MKRSEFQECVKNIPNVEWDMDRIVEVADAIHQNRHSVVPKDDITKLLRYQTLRFNGELDLLELESCWNWLKHVHLA